MCYRSVTGSVYCKCIPVQVCDTLFRSVRVFSGTSAASRSFFPSFLGVSFWHFSRFLLQSPPAGSRMSTIFMLELFSLSLSLSLLCPARGQKFQSHNFYYYCSGPPLSSRFLLLSVVSNNKQLYLVRCVCVCARQKSNIRNNHRFIRLSGVSVVKSGRGDGWCWGLMLADGTSSSEGLYRYPNENRPSRSYLEAHPLFLHINNTCDVVKRIRADRVITPRVFLYPFPTGIVNSRDMWNLKRDESLPPNLIRPHYLMFVFGGTTSL